MTREERYYSDIGRIELLAKFESVNAYLEEGWELLKISEVTDGTETRAIVYVVGQRKEGSPRGDNTQTAKPVAKGKPCNKCGVTITFEKIGEKWKAKNLDGTDHRDAK